MADCVVLPSSELKQKVNNMGHNDEVAYLFAALCGIKGSVEAVTGGGASTPVSAQVNVVETAGGTVLAAAVPAGQIVEIFNAGLVNVTLRIAGDPAIGTGFILPPGAVYTTPRPITTAIKGITAAGESATVHVTRFP